MQPLRLLTAALTALAGLGTTGLACAGGYDTPMLYSARHMGMGGAAVGYVRDPSALFHNPAGLGHVRRVSALADFSLLVGDIHGSPSATARNVSSETTIGPFFLVGGGVRLTDFLVLGFGLYPIASAGATYHYGNDLENTTKLLFVEASLAIAVNLPGSVRLGVGYRVTYVRLERYQGSRDRDTTPFIDLSLTGHDFEGLRFGAQWTPLPELEVGLAYRHLTDTEVSSEAGIAFAEAGRDVSTHFTLPSRFAAGVRYDWVKVTGIPLASALDLEYALQSQNEGDPLEGTRVSNGRELSVPNVFEWSDALTVRFGLEYAIGLDSNARERRMLVRAGYVYDAKTANEHYPTAFGTPPAPTQVLTAGLGYDDGTFQANLAYARRFGSGEVTEADLEGQKTCRFCGVAGDYSIRLNGFYVDVGLSY
jgi:long-subunit fatty acid transport protein